MVYPTVDVAIIRSHKGNYQVLLGRKDKEEGWCFPGGFVDPTDNSYMEAAKRELHEEVTGIATTNLTYIASTKINDPRMKDGDIIITTFFLTSFIDGTPKAGDDLDEVRWFNLEDNLQEILVEKHKVLLNLLNF